MRSTVTLSAYTITIDVFSHINKVDKDEWCASKMPSHYFMPPQGQSILELTKY